MKAARITFENPRGNGVEQVVRQLRKRGSRRSAGETECRVQRHTHVGRIEILTIKRQWRPEE
jgi:hypothetical protein